MFEPSDTARLFYLPLGVDYPAAVLAGLRDRLAGHTPDAMARVTVLVNTRRMERRLTALFQEGPAGFLPKIRLITDLIDDLPDPDSSEQGAGLIRRLELEQLVAALLDAEPDLAPRSASFDLADSLINLLGEMQGEGVAFDRLESLDVSNLSAHWDRSLRFLRLLAPVLADPAAATDPEAKLRRAVEGLAARWQDTPPKDPILVVGSTGSRGPTRLLMQAVATLPQGAVILPGFDRDLPDAVWHRLDDLDTAEDHPQYRFRVLMRALNLTPDEIAPWCSAMPASDGRNCLISLGLRPAPVTDQWRREGPHLPDLEKATDGLTLIETPDARTEATAIALAMRKALEDGDKVALITPDRMLTRQVTAILDRWRILPDDSAGRPLSLSAPGRFLRLVTDVMANNPAPERVVSLLKHPLCHSGGGRGDHQRLTRNLELALRDGRNGGRGLVETIQGDGDLAETDWAAWLLDWLAAATAHAVTAPVVNHVATHLDLAERLATGSAPAAHPAGELWLKEAGIEARAAFDSLQAAAPAGGPMPMATYRRMILSLMAGRQVRSPAQPHPDIMIWGTMEARVQGVDLVILGGLNDGIWPQLPKPDPWLNRQMRAEAGLLSPERAIGLSAHDFEQSITQPRVILTRAQRDAEAQTVPSRWLNRLTNLLNGLGDDGAAALSAMRARGAPLIDLARRLDQPDQPTPPAPRPAPCPPVPHRPRQLSVTRIETLIRDPYSIYAQRILGLFDLRPLRHRPDPGLRGTVLHHALEHFVAQTRDGLPDNAFDLLTRITDQALDDFVPWPSTRLFWRGRLLGIGEAFLADEHQRRHDASPIALEHKGRAALPDGFVLTAEADRIDRDGAGQLLIYDYKTGTLPSKKVIDLADKQLPLEGAIARLGGFGPDVPAAPVRRLAHIGIAKTYELREIDLTDDPITAAWDGLTKLIGAYGQPGQGYAALRMAHSRDELGPYAHLARFGEWDLTDPTTPEEMG